MDGFELNSNQQACPWGSHDLLIASHALSLRVTLITSNMREFGRVEGLHVEQWI